MPTELRGNPNQPPKDEATKSRETRDEYLMAGYLAEGTFSNAVELERTAGFGPEYFRNAKTLDLIERGIQERWDAGNRTANPFSGLENLPIPKGFFRRRGVRFVALDVVRTLLSGGNADAIDIMRLTNTEEAALAGYGAAAELGMNNAAGRGDLLTLREIAGAFRIDLASVGEANVRFGSVHLANNGLVDDLVAFSEAFPGMVARFIEQGNARQFFPPGIRKLILTGNLEDADRLAAIGNVGADVMRTTVEGCIRSLIVQEDAEVLARLQKQWDIPASTILREGTEAVTDQFSQFKATMRVGRRNAADAGVESMAPTEFERSMLDALAKAERIRDWLSLPRDAFERGVLAGLSKRVDFTVERIRAIQRIVDADGSFDGRIERACTLFLIRDKFNNESGDLIAQARLAFPSLTDADVRSAAVDMMARNMGMNGTPHAAFANGWLRDHGIKPVAWKEVATDATTFARYLLAEARPLDFERFARAMGATPEERNAVLDGSREEMRDRVLRVDLSEETRRELFDAYGFAWEDFPFSKIPLPLIADATDPDLLDYARRKDPWHASLAALLRLQGRSANEEHDAWTNELFPLVDELCATGLLDRESSADGALLVEYAKTFGMLNMQRIARVFLRLRRGPFASLPEEDRLALVDAIGPKAARLESPHVIHELRKLRLDLQRNLLLDRVPRAMGTALGEETFHGLRGTTAWERDDSVAEILRMWEATVASAKAEAVQLEQKAIRAIADADESLAARLYAQADAAREAVSVAKGYEETSFAVPRVYRSKDGATTADAEIKKAVDDYPAFRLHRFSRVAGELARLSMSALRSIANGEATVPSGNADPFPYLATVLGIHAPPGLAEDADAIRRSFLQPNDLDAVSRMEHIAATSDDFTIANYLLALSAVHLARTAPAQWVEHLARAQIGTDEQTIRHRAEFVVQYLKEHYLSPAQNPDHTGHAPFSETLRLALERAWGAGGDATTNGLLRADARIAEIRAKQTRLSADTADVTLVPVQGPGRLFAGDIGDACYSSQHEALARGDCPGVKALLFVTNRGKATERLAGSVLFVEARTPRGERVLVIRANNPRENLIAALDAPTLVSKTIETAVETARRRQIKHVAVVRDGGSGASSNREGVSAYYEQTYEGLPPTRLVSSAETRFNDYPIWDSSGDCPTVVVWTNDDPEAT